MRALEAVDLELAAGEVLALVGENGAGKSTLIKILSGVLQPDGGTIHWQGQPVELTSARDAFDAGIATIHQELAYFAKLSVAENLLLGEPWPRLWWGGIDWSRLNSIAGERLRKFGARLDPGALFDSLSPAEKQEVALVRALCRDARLLILDEPTASLTEREVKRLFEQIQRLRARGVAILYISHRLTEVLELADRVAVLRDGSLVSTYPRLEADIDRLVRDMVGRDLVGTFPHERSATGAVVLEIDGLTRANDFHDVSLTMRAGEVTGLAGLVGSGRSELARALYGLYRVDRGTMRLRGKEWAPQNPHAALKAGLVYLPEERKRQALVSNHSVGSTVSIGFSDLISRVGVVPWRAERGRLLRSLERYDIRATGIEQAVGTLSGGNQQKAVLARWLERDPTVLLLDEPTRGVDVGAKAEIHKLIDELAAAGRAVLLISSDLPEILGMSDRVLVMHEGTIVSELTGAQKSEENVILAASGLSRFEEEA